MNAILMLLSLWLHVASLVVWLGGMTFFVRILLVLGLMLGHGFFPFQG